MPPTLRRSGAAAALVVVALGLSACTQGPPEVEVGPTTTPTTAPVPTPSSSSAAAYGPAAADPRLDSFYSQKLTWTRCGGEFQCTTLTVPLSYDDPAAGSLGVKVLRYRTDRDEDYLGSLVVNPGGPGGSGIDYARAARAITTDAVRARYDIVGFDPRGVATSDPIDCLDDKQTDAFIAADASPDDAAEAARLTALSAQFGASCQANSPNLVGHISTRDVAKDMDILRQALGDQKLAYLGKSYGTAIGSTYAELFPQNVGRLVLDGAIDPALDLTEMGKGQALGFELALSRFFAACPTLDGCPFPKDAAAASAKLAGLLDRIDASPLPAQPGRPLTQALAVLGIVGNLYSPDSWPELAYALSEAFDGDGNALLNSADYYADRNTDGTYNSNANDALYAVNCYDRPATPGATETAALASAWEKQAPHFGAYLAWGNLPCATWPAHSDVPPHAVAAAGAPPILVVGTRYDPATPVGWAKALAGQLDSGVLLEWIGDGHTAYTQGSGCVDQAIDAFLLDGVPPKDGAVCR